MSTFEYSTIKDKHNPKQKSYGFGPKAHSQWHWFFVAKKTLRPSNEKGVVEMKLELDKFQLAQGKCKPMTGKHIYTYGADGAKQLKTAARKKRELMELVIGDTDEQRAERLKRAKAHKEALNLRGTGTMRFIDAEGKEVFYTGMVIGGEHDWDYQDTDAIQRGVVNGKEAKPETRRLAKGVRWREVKVHQHRWAIAVNGRLHGQPMEEEEESVLIADQMATKLSPTSYHVALKGVSIPLKGKNAEERNARYACIIKMLANSLVAAC
mmetsp:Transcript_32504/g.60480  ORF Transcript_32504/g.60480 Transcript_32504/m.60480 type:complete len:266 (-) Transcript_32504:35-832(-)